MDVKQWWLVFDDYTDIPTPNDIAQLRRTMGHIGKTATFVSDITLNMMKDMFLVNILNKQHFINMLIEKLNDRIIQTHHSACDNNYIPTTLYTNVSMYQ